MHLTISSAKWRPFCPGGDELISRPASVPTTETSLSMAMDLMTKMNMKEEMKYLYLQG